MFLYDFCYWKYSWVGHSGTKWYIYNIHTYVNATPAYYNDTCSCLRRCEELCRCTKKWKPFCKNAKNSQKLQIDNQIWDFIYVGMFDTFTIYYFYYLLNRSQKLAKNHLAYLFNDNCVWLQLRSELCVYDWVYEKHICSMTKFIREIRDNIAEVESIVCISVIV